MTVINDAVSTNNSGYVGWSQTLCDVALPTLSSTYNDPNGNGYMQIYRMSMNVSGKDASRTVALGIWNTSNALIGKTANFTEAAASSASSTGNKTLTTVPLIKRNGSGSSSAVRMGFWVSGNGYVYYSRDTTNQTTNIYSDQTGSSSITTFSQDTTLRTASSLVGTYDYYTLPSSPASISTAAGNAQVTVSWAAPSANGGTAVTSYTLQRATNSGFTTGLVTTTGLTGTSTLVTGLTNGTPYYFRVSAVNAVATAASTTSSWRTTGSSVTPALTSPPGPPTGLTIADQTVHNNTGLKLTWVAPGDTGGSAITKYRVTYSLSPDFSSPVSIDTPTTAVTYDYNDLRTNTIYYFYVQATNTTGTGAASEPAVGYTYTASAPGVGVVKRYNSVIAQWVVVV